MVCTKKDEADAAASVGSREVVGGALPHDASASSVLHDEDAVARVALAVDTRAGSEAATRVDVGLSLPPPLESPSPGVPLRLTAGPAPPVVSHSPSHRMSAPGSLPDVLVGA